MIKETLRIGGMSCAACAVKIEESVRKVDGVEEATANYGNNTMTAEYSARTHRAPPATALERAR